MTSQSCREVVPVLQIIPANSTRNRKNERNVIRRSVEVTVAVVILSAVTDMPEILGVPVFGRDELVTELFKKLVELNATGKILLYGLPGIGKTQTIIRFLQIYQQQFEHVIWLDVNISLQKTFIENKRLIE